MREVKQINIKNWAYYFYNDINSKNFDAELLKIDKKLYKYIRIYNIGYITKKKIHDYENINSVSGYIEEKDFNPLYLHSNHASGYFEEKVANKYLIFDSTDQNKKLLKKI